MNILGRKVTLAKQPAPDAKGQERGSSGGAYPTHFGSERRLERIKDPTIGQIMKMLDEDGTAAGLYNVITFPVLATDYRLIPDPEDNVVVGKDEEGNDIVSHPQAELAEKALRNAQHKGGMSTPFKLVLADMLLGVAQGYRIFEIVYKLNEQRQIIFKKIVSRDHNSVEILKDDTGGFAGFKQKVRRKNGNTEDVTIDLPYSFLFTYRKERDPLKGKSAFRAGFYHYDKKHRLYFLANQQGQQAAINPKVLKSPEGATQDDKDANLNAVDRMAVRASIELPEGWELDFPTISKGVDLMPYIDHHNVEMARSVLAQMMMLGTQSDSKGGSYALSENQTDLFMLGETMLISALEEHINSYLIAKLIDYNFETAHYPTFKFNDMSDAVSALLREAFKGLVSKGTVPDWVNEGIAEKVAEQMEIERPKDDLDDDQSAAVAQSGEAIQSQALNGAQITSLLEIVTSVATGALPPDTAIATIKAGFPALTEDQVNAIVDPVKNFTPAKTDDATPPASTTTEQSRKSKKKERLAKTDYWRELTAAESKVNFDKINEKAETAEEKFLADAREVFDRVRDDAVERLEPLIDEKGAKALDGFELKFADDLQKVMADHMTSTYADAKKQCADELKVKAPANQADSKALIGEHAQAIVDKQYSDMLFNAKTIVTDAVRKNLLDKTELALSDVMKSIFGMFDDFFDEKETLTATTIITTAINIGRDDVFRDNESDIYGYQYSGLLDEAICAICKDLDGSVATPDDYAATIWVPPIHFNCRCIWVAIMKDEVDPPDFTGIPDSPGGADAPSLSKEWQGVIYLSKELEMMWLKRRT